MNLSTIARPDGFFTISAFDHRGSLAKMFGIDQTDPEAGPLLTQLKILFMKAFSDLSSGVLVDPLYGFPAVDIKDENCGLLLSLESSGYTDEKSAVPTLIPNWSVRHVKNNYAVAKILVYFHPQDKNADAKRKLLQELYQFCQHEDIAFLIEPIIFNPNGSEALDKAEFQEIQLQTCQEFQRYCDILKIEYPGDALSCATLTAELDVPWIVLSRGVSFDEFVVAVQTSLESGAKGFAVGRAIWQEIGEMRHAETVADYQKIEEFLMTIGRERLQQLLELVNQTAHGHNQ